MKHAFSLLFSLLVFTGATANDPLPALRKAFVEATINAASREAFHKLAETAQKGSHLHLAYLGAAKAMWAENSYNPYTKLKLFQSGTELLERAVAANPTCAETRYLRLLIQLNTPDFLGYQNSIADDWRHLRQPTLHQEDWYDHYKRFERAYWADIQRHLKP